MELLLAGTVGFLYAAGLYLLLRRTLVKMLIGLGLLTNAANLMIFVAAGAVRGEPPIVPPGAEALADAPQADPLPQALILTAIVIGFAVLAFAMVLAYRSFDTTGSDDPDRFRTTERLDPPLEHNHEPSPAVEAEASEHERAVTV
jgi:multicomponent Na+:H+ antiporter subunit C